MRNRAIRIVITLGHLSDGRRAIQSLVRRPARFSSKMSMAPGTSRSTVSDTASSQGTLKVSVEGVGNRINIVTRLYRQQPMAHQGFDFANVYLHRQATHTVTAALPVQAHTTT